jgi:predicted ester cyclase
MESPVDKQRRRVLEGLAAAGAAATLPGCVTATPSLADRNKAIVRRYKLAQSTADEAEVMRETLAPNYRRTRAGLEHLAANARGQGFPAPGPGLRNAIPDRVDIIENIIADGDTVGLLWRLTGTHRGDLYGIPSTGRKISVYEIGIFKLAEGRIAEAWFMADEAGLLLQLGEKLPPRNDGKLIAPPITDAGEDGDVVLQRLLAAPPTRENRNEAIVARSKSSHPGPRTPEHRQKRLGLQHMREYGEQHGTAQFTPTHAFPGRNDRITGMLAEGDAVWMQFNLRGTHQASFYGLPPTGRRVEMPEIGIMRVVDGQWMESWYFGDELGLLLQLGAVDMLST